MSACLKYQLVDGLRKSKMTMSYRLVKNSHEYWRVGTGMFIFDLESPLDICTLVALFSSLSALERRFFKGSPTGMITTLAFIASLLVAPGFYIRDLRLKDPAMMMYIAIVTWATLRCFFRPTAGARSVAAALTPLVPIIAPHLRKGAMDIALVKHQGMAIAAGLACVLLIPDVEGARALRQQRQKAATRKKAKEAKAGGGAGAGVQAAPVDESSSSEEEEEEEQEGDSSEEEEEEEDSE